MTREELIRDEDYSEEEAERMVLQNKLDKANERIEELEDIINQIKLKINNDLNINKRCLKEEPYYFVKRLIEIWNNYNKEMLELLKED